MSEATKNKKNKMLMVSISIMVAIILLIVIVILGRDLYKAKSLQLKKTLVTTSPKPEIEKIDIEEIEFEEREEGVGKQLTIEEIRQIQMEKLRKDIETKGPTSRPGKYPTMEELEEMEESGAVLY